MPINKCTSKKFPRPLPPVPTKSTATSAANAMQSIQAVETTTATLSTTSAPPQNTQAARPTALIGKCRTALKFFSARSEKLAVELNKTRKNSTLSTQEQKTALQAIETKTTALITEIATTVAELDPQCAELKTSRGKDTAITLLSLLKTIGETAQAILLQCQESARAITPLLTFPKAETYFEVVNNVDTYQQMPERFSATLASLCDEFLNLLKQPENDSVQDQAKWRALVSQQKSLCEQLKTQIKAVTAYINITNAQINANTDDDAGAVKRQLIRIKQNLLNTLTQAELDRFPKPSPTEFAAEKEKGYQHFIKQRFGLTQRVTNLRSRMMTVARDESITETQRQVRLTPLFGKRKLLTREALFLKKKLPRTIPKAEAPKEQVHLNKIIDSLKELEEKVKEITDRRNFLN